MPAADVDEVLDLGLVGDVAGDDEGLAAGELALLHRGLTDPRVLFEGALDLTGLAAGQYIVVVGGVQASFTLTADNRAPQWVPVGALRPHRDAGIHARCHRPRDVGHHCCAAGAPLRTGAATATADYGQHEVDQRPQ